jgi:glyoxylase-like metal-dependent hydrolase (beta-lactamase superfamily II)
VTECGLAHLDHVAGAGAFAPSEIIGHEKCAEYWKAVDAKVTGKVVLVCDGRG